MHIIDVKKDVKCMSLPVAFPVVASAASWMRE